MSLCMHLVRTHARMHACTYWSRYVHICMLLPFTSFYTCHGYTILHKGFKPNPLKLVANLLAGAGISSILTCRLLAILRSKGWIEKVTKGEQMKGALTPNAKKVRGRVHDRLSESPKWQNLPHNMPNGCRRRRWRESLPLTPAPLQSENKQDATWQRYPKQLMTKQREPRGSTEKRTTSPWKCMEVHIQNTTLQVWQTGQLREVDTRTNPPARSPSTHNRLEDKMHRSLIIGYTYVICASSQIPCMDYSMRKRYLFHVIYNPTRSWSRSWHIVSNTIFSQVSVIDRTSRPPILWTYPLIWYMDTSHVRIFLHNLQSKNDMFWHSPTYTEKLWLKEFG